VSRKKKQESRRCASLRGVEAKIPEIVAPSDLADRLSRVAWLVGRVDVASWIVEKFQSRKRERK